MTLAVGANLYGFVVGGSLFCVQLITIGIFQFFVGDTRMHGLEEPTFVFIAGISVLLIGAIGLFLVLAILFWLTSVIIVFPFSLLVKVLSVPRWLTGIIGGLIAGSLCFFFLSSPGVGDSIPLMVWISCLSSSIITGAVTGFMLSQLSINKLGIKSEVHR